MSWRSSKPFTTPAALGRMSSDSLSCWADARILHPLVTWRVVPCPDRWPRCEPRSGPARPAARWPRPWPERDDLVRTGVIDSAGQVIDTRVEPVRNTYPTYTLHYRMELTRCLRELGRYGNLLLAGRCGCFWHNNADHSIGQALTMLDRILAGEALSQIDEGRREY